MATRFLWNNLWDTGTLTVTTEDANFPVTNTQHRWWQKAWRSTGTVANYLVADLGSAQAINAIALKYNNFSATADIDLYGDSDSGFSPPEYSQAISTIDQDVMIQYFAATQTYQYWNLKIDDAAVADSYHTVGRIFLGSYFTPTRDFRIGGGRKSRIDTSALNAGEHGHITSIVLEKHNAYEYVFPCLPASDVTTFVSMYNTLGMAQGFFFTEDSTAPTTTTYYVRFAAPLGIQQEENALYSVAVSLVETM